MLAPSHRGAMIARVPRGRAEDVATAVAAARSAFPDWSSHHFTVRQRALLEAADAIEARAADLARVMALETGNALRTQASVEVASLVSLFRYFAGVAGEAKGTVLPAGDGQLQYTRREPLGVVGAIMPWNSPLLIAGLKIPAALAAGNTVVVKAAEDAPLAVLMMAELVQPHLPPGTLNVVTGYGAECGAPLAAHPGVDKVTFTGSTAVGRGVAATAAERLVRCSLELGGKSPTVVFPQEVTDELADQIILAMRITRQGQSCTAGSRLFAHREIHDELLERVAARLAALRVGDPLSLASDIGSLINQAQFDRVCGYLRSAADEPGARFVHGEPGPPSEPELSGGYYLRPALIAGVDNGWRIAREEIFGPVLAAIPWTDVEDVVAMANDTHYGLAAFVFGDQMSQVLSVAHRLQAGWVQVNQGGGQVAGQSFGGYKDSGMGREASLEGMLEGLTQIKQINVRLGR
ncbi:aldehyde dehydrogenase family protein [Thermocatellispora tengchongensis]|uniref:aldehyde dehydrogenase family protein n=1 Tax=Thermocatellispora tengchongensis TaxID=1073253 RepID=UPI00363007D5